MTEKGKNELIEKVVEVKRVSKVVKGGRRFSFSALVVVGDGNGRVGVGLGKANEVVEAVRKGNEKAKKDMKFYNLYNGTIPHRVEGKHGAAKILMQPGRAGSGIISSGAVRAVAETLGITDINAKSKGSNNVNNMVYAALNGFGKLKSFSDIAERRGKKVEEICLLDL